MQPFIIYFTIIGLYIGYQVYTTKRRRTLAYSNQAPTPSVVETDIVLRGDSLNLHEVEVEEILNKRFAYFRDLAPELKERFLQRIRKFMDDKIFIIKYGEGFKEMPVLVSAAAIQLSFGLKDYLMPFYKYIRIYPEEYVAPHALKVLAGNVSGCTITVSWNHFLKGYEDLTDGSNVGLHEMSHALYFQKEVVYQDHAIRFNRRYRYLMEKSADAYDHETKGRYNLYSAYAESNMQEFWAESVELFFEKPHELRQIYPDVFEGMCALLRQDPCNKAMPIEKKKPVRDRLKSISIRRSTIH
ncbi:MAG TPA: zinc-dependent peptidase [Chitinophagaceae bacterium]